MTKVLLGFKVPSGEPYYVPIHHTSFTGMSDLSGKSTGQEAKYRREVEVEPKRKILVFLTKRGEKTFFGANKIKPFYKAQGDWEHIRGLLEASWHERLKFETPWLYNVCKYPTLAKSEEEVFERLHTAIERDEEPKTGKPIRDFDKKIYTHLYAYLEKIIPVIRASKDQFSDKLELKPGLNVMDLTPWYANEEVQTLSIASAMKHILSNEYDTDIGMPEAWKMLPEGRNTPVKLLFERYIREGATNGNFLTIDAQDLGGVDKTHLRQVSIWIMGKMMQINEVKRLLEQIPRVPVKPEDFQTLKLGHFYAVNGIENTVDLIYIWPWDVPEGMAMAVAKEALEPEVIKKWLLEKREMALEKSRIEGSINHQAFDSLVNVVKDLKDILRDHIGDPVVHPNLEERLNRFSEQLRLQRLAEKVDALDKKLTFSEIIPMKEGETAEEYIKRVMPAALQTIEGDATLQQTKWNVKVQSPKVEFKIGPEPGTPEGKLMWLAKEGFFNDWRQWGEIDELLEKKGWAMERTELMGALEKLVTQGFLGKRKWADRNRTLWKLPNLVTIIE